MGFRDQVRIAGEQKEAEKALRERAASPEGIRYVTEVNKGSINMAAYQQHLNEMWAQGFRVHTVLEQHGNTMTIFERRD